eukprot:scaffold98044_cov72-Phaeocystis_antarctica.AAC.9
MTARQGRGTTAEALVEALGDRGINYWPRICEVVLSMVKVRRVAVVAAPSCRPRRRPTSGDRRQPCGSAEQQLLDAGSATKRHQRGAQRWDGPPVHRRAAHYVFALLRAAKRFVVVPGPRLRPRRIDYGYEIAEVQRAQQ